MRAVRKFRPEAPDTCDFGRPNALKPSVVFTGCPNCHNVSQAGTSVEDVEADMLAFMEKHS